MERRRCQLATSLVSVEPAKGASSSQTHADRTIWWLTDGRCARIDPAERMAAPAYEPSAAPLTPKASKILLGISFSGNSSLADRTPVSMK